MSTEKIVEIDIAKVLKSKAPNTWVPNFVIQYLRRIAHETELNDFFKSNSNLRNLDFIEAGLHYLNVTMSLEGKENLPSGGKYIFASNHPLGGLDGIAMGYLLGKEYEGKVKFFSNDLLMNVYPIRELFVPVNKTGAQSRSHAEMMQQFYESDNHLITYPSGMCSRKINGEIMDLEWKKNFIKKSIEFQRDVVPVYFEGRNSSFFYNLASIRKFLGLKFNVEMLYLSDEMFKQKGRHFTVRIGEPVAWQTFDKSKTATEWAEWMKRKVYSMRK
jgi:1-acyl-sn-glycerol-3-phosphate acyltransferase